MYQAGTLSGNPLATAAGLAVLQAVTAGGLRRADRRVAPLRQGPRVGAVERRACRLGVRSLGTAGRALRGAGRRAAARGTGRLRRARGDLAGNGVYAPFFHAMLRRGVALAPGPYEVLFPGLAHDDGGPGRGGGGRRGGRGRGGGRASARLVRAGALAHWTLAPEGAVPDTHWPEGFAALRRGEGCPMCGRNEDETPHGIRVFAGRWAGRVPRAVPRPPGLCLRDLERPPRRGADGALGRRGRRVLVRGGPASPRAVDERYRPAKMNWLSLGNGVPAPPRPPGPSTTGRPSGRLAARDRGLPRRADASPSTRGIHARGGGRRDAGGPRPRGSDGGDRSGGGALEPVR